MEPLRESRLRTSFTEPRQIMGVEIKLFLVNASTAVFMLTQFRLWEWLILTVLAHMFLKNMTKNDPDALGIYIKYGKQADRYEPWPMAGQERNQRPAGFGRGRIC